MKKGIDVSSLGKTHGEQFEDLKKGVEAANKNGKYLSEDLVLRTQKNNRNGGQMSDFCFQETIHGKELRFNNFNQARVLMGPGPRGALTDSTLKHASKPPRSTLFGSPAVKTAQAMSM